MVALDEAQEVVRSQDLPGVLSLVAPTAPALPLVFDSPHSGTVYPADFRPAAPLDALRRAQDSHVDRLFARAPEHGATLLAARFPRIYIDVNRPLDDLDPDLLAAPWPGPLDPSERTRRGLGLIWRLCPGGAPAVYDRKLPVAEVEARIERYWRPYHRTLKATIAALHRRFGQVWHVNCHSMHSVSSAMHAEGPGVRRPDFVLGDRDGTSCAPALLELVRQFLADAGHSVALNQPYKGLELVRAYSDPAGGRHSLQIEIARRLYMDEASLLPNAGFSALQGLMTGLSEALGVFVRARLG